MLRYSRSHGWCSLKPFMPADESFNSQALMLNAEVVNSSNQIHPCFKRFTQACYGSPPSHKSRQALSKRRVESFYKGRVDYSCALCLLDHSFDFGLAALNDPAVNANNPSLLILFYRLRD